MSRSEAKGVPKLLVAPKETEGGEGQLTYDTETSKPGGYYADGAYTAVADPESLSEALHVDMIDNANREPQDVYHDTLLASFSYLRRRLRYDPPTMSSGSLDRDHPTDLSIWSKGSFARWKGLLSSTDPMPLQIARMNQATVRRLLEIVTKNSLSEGRNVSERVGRWVWALLARLEEPGCLASEEVSVIRELGKRAVWLLRALTQEDDANVLEDRLAEEKALHPHWILPNSEEEEQFKVVTGQDLAEYPASCAGANTPTPEAPTINTTMKDGPVQLSVVATDSPLDQVEEGEIEDEQLMIVDRDTVEAAKAQLMSQLHVAPEAVEASQGSDSLDPETERFPSSCTRATLDMIVTIAGEFYRQRDLLEFRERWRQNV